MLILGTDHLAFRGEVMFFSPARFYIHTEQISDYIWWSDLGMKSR